MPAYEMRRVIGIKGSYLDAFIVGARIAPGTRTHLHPPRDLVDVG